MQCEAAPEVSTQASMDENASQALRKRFLAFRAGIASSKTVGGKSYSPGKPTDYQIHPRDSVPPEVNVTSSDAGVASDLLSTPGPDDIGFGTRPTIASNSQADTCSLPPRTLVAAKRFVAKRLDGVSSDHVLSEITQGTEGQKQMTVAVAVATHHEDDDDECTGDTRVKYTTSLLPASSFSGKTWAGASRLKSVGGSAGFDANSPNALILVKPSEGSNERTLVMDPLLSDKLRPHQRDGCKFIIEACLGRKALGPGCLLADDMGLGKTLQTIATIWTFLHQA